MGTLLNPFYLDFRFFCSLHSQTFVQYFEVFFFFFNNFIHFLFPALLTHRFGGSFRQVVCCFSASLFYSEWVLKMDCSWEMHLKWIAGTFPSVGIRLGVQFFTYSRPVQSGIFSLAIFSVTHRITVNFFKCYIWVILFLRLVIILLGRCAGSIHHGGVRSGSLCSHFVRRPNATNSLRGLFLLSYV